MCQLGKSAYEQGFIVRDIVLNRTYVPHGRALILNKMIGTGIFVVPAKILAITGSKGISLILWLVGAIITWAG
jgi:hypothetical protein